MYSQSIFFCIFFFNFPLSLLCVFLPVPGREVFLALAELTPFLLQLMLSHLHNSICSIANQLERWFMLCYFARNRKWKRLLCAARGAMRVAEKWDFFDALQRGGRSTTIVHGIAAFIACVVVCWMCLLCDEAMRSLLWSLCVPSICTNRNENGAHTLRCEMIDSSIMMPAPASQCGMRYRYRHANRCKHCATHTYAFTLVHVGSGMQNKTRN